MYEKRGKCIKQQYAPKAPTPSPFHLLKLNTSYTQPTHTTEKWPSVSTITNYPQKTPLSPPKKKINKIPKGLTIMLGFLLYNSWRFISSSTKREFEEWLILVYLLMILNIFYLQMLEMGYPSDQCIVPRVFVWDNAQEQFPTSSTENKFQAVS